MSLQARVNALKLLDRYAGTICATLLPEPRKDNTAVITAILVIRPGGLGDALLLAPALNTLKTAFPDAVVTVLAEKRNVAAYTLIPSVDCTILYDVPSELMRLLRSRFDLVIDTEQWHRLSAVIARLIRSDRKIGFNTNNRGRMFTDKVGYDQSNYEVRSFLDLIAPLGLFTKFDPNIPFLKVPSAAIHDAEYLLDGHGDRFIAIFTGASIMERKIDPVKIHDVVQRLESNGVKSIVIGGSQEAETAQVIVSGTKALNLAGRTSLQVTAALIARSKAFLSSDSGLLHIAAGLAVPTISLFGSGIADKWAPKRSIDIVLNKQHSCSPCTVFGTTPPCPYGVKCLADISATEIYDAVVSVLDSKNYF